MNFNIMPQYLCYAKFGHHPKHKPAQLVSPFIRLLTTVLAIALLLGCGSEYQESSPTSTGNPNTNYTSRLYTTPARQPAHANDLANYHLILSPTTIELGEHLPSHVRYQVNVPITDITTYYTFNLCKVNPKTHAIISSTCISPFYDDHGPLILNLHTLKTIKDPLEKVGLILEAGLQLTFDTYGLITENPAKVATAAGIGTLGTIAAHQALTSAKLWSYKELLTFTRSPEFKSLGLNSVKLKHNPGVVLRAILKTGVWKKDPFLAQAAFNTASRLAAKTGVHLITTFSLGVIIATTATLISAQLIPEHLKQQLNAVARDLAKSGHDYSNQLISQEVQKQLANTNTVNPQLMKFAIRWNEQTLFTASSSTPSPSKLDIAHQALIPALGYFLKSLERPYIIPIKKYCLPAAATSAESPAMQQSYSFGRLSTTPTTPTLDCVNI